MKPALALLVLASALARPAIAEPVRNGSSDVVTRKGRTVIQLKNDAVQVVIGYRYASRHMGARWTFFETLLSATNGKPIEIAREDIQLISPMGTIPLASQKKMSEGIPDVRRMLTEAAVSRDPLDGYFPGRPRRNSIAFFTVPGEGIVFDRVTVDRQTLAGGDLFFESPTGVFAPGKYELQIRNKAVDVKVPFNLPADDEPLGRRKDQNDKAVPW